MAQDSRILNAKTQRRRDWKTVRSQRHGARLEDSQRNDARTQRLGNAHASRSTATASELVIARRSPGCWNLRTQSAPWRSLPSGVPRSEGIATPSPGLPVRRSARRSHAALAETRARARDDRCLTLHPSSFRLHPSPSTAAPTRKTPPARSPPPRAGTTATAPCDPPAWPPRAGGADIRSSTP